MRQCHLEMGEPKQQKAGGAAKSLVTNFSPHTRIDHSQPRQFHFRAYITYRLRFSTWVVSEVSGLTSLLGGCA